MTCARYRALISRYLDDELTPRQRAELVAHIEQCASCSADLARYRQDELLLRKLPEGQPKPELKTAVLREARRAGRRRHRRLRWFLSAGGRVSPRLVVTVLAIVLLLPVAISLGLSSAARQAIGAPFGFSAPRPSPTVPYLDVPASPTPAPPGPLSPPHLVTTNPYDGATGVDPRTTLLVGFDQPMDRRSVERAFRLAPPVVGDFQWEADNQVRFRPKAPGLLRGVSYSVALTDGARSLAGGVLAPATVWSFRTLPGAVLQAVFPPAAAVDVPATTTLVLTFSQPIDQAPGASLRVEPDVGADPAGRAPGWALRGRATWSADGRVLRVIPEAPLPAQAIRVTLDAGTRDTRGTAVPPSSWTFAVAPPSAEVTLDGPWLRVAVPGEAGPAIGYSASTDSAGRSGGGVHFALYPLAETELAARVPWLLDAGAPGAGGPWPPVPTAGQAALRTWTAGSGRGAGQAGGPLGGSVAESGLTTTVPIREPGLYLLSADVAGDPVGAHGAQRVLALSDEGLLLWLDNGRWWAWVSSLGSGQAVAGAQVRFYDAAGGLLVTGTTDNQGLFGAALPPGAQPALALAEHSGNMTIARVPATGLPPAIAATDNRLGATVILDRPRYQPGDTLLFSALVRSPSLALAGAAVGVHLYDPAGRDIAALSLEPDAHSAINGAFPLAAGLEPGAYGLVFDVGGYAYAEPVPVDAAGAPAGAAALQLSLQVPGSAGYAGDTISATVRAGYGAARPATGLAITLELAPLDRPSDPGRVVTATTDDTGLVQVPIRLPAWDPEDAPGPTRTYRLLARAVGSLGRPAAALALLDVRASHLDITQVLQQHIFVPGASTLVTVTVQDEAGRPLVGQVVSSGLYTPHPPAGGASPAGPGQGGSLMASMTRLTDAAGVATATLAVPLQGAFVIRSVVSDSTGLTATAATRVWAYQAGSAVLWAIALPPATAPALTADQDSYRPGETAQLLLQAGAPGGGLLVAALGGRVVAIQAIRFGAGGGVFAVPIPTDPGAAGTLDVRFLRFAAEDGDPHLLTRAIALPLRPASDLELTLPAAPGPAGYLPGQPLALHLALHAAGSAPVGGEALVQLAPLTPDSLDADRTAAYWGPDLPLDSSGALSTTLGLPDRPGLWTLDAWAFLTSGVSHTRQIVRIAAPIAVAWSVPGDLVQGDSTSLVATVTNNQPVAAALDVRVQLGGEAVLDLAGATTQGLRLAPGETRSLTWTLHALTGGMPAGPGQVTLDIAGGPPGFPIHRQQAIVVTPYGVSAAQSHAGLVADTETINMTLPPDVDPGSATLEVRCAPSLAGVLADTVAAQSGPAGAERGPVDAATARLVAAAAVQALYARQGRDPADLPAGLAEADQIDLQNLYGAQGPSGGWGAWLGAPPDLTTSVHVLQALWELAHDAGLQVDAETVRRGLAWVRQAAAVPLAPGADGDLALSAGDAARVAEAIYVRSLFNEPVTGDLDRLLAGDPQLAARDRAFLALALARSGRGAEAHLVVARLAADAAGGAPDPVVLDALLTADPAGFDAAAVPLASALLAARSGAGWPTPAGTAGAVLALSHYAVLLPAPPAVGSYRIVVNGQVIRDVVVGPSGAPAGSGSGRVVLTIPSSRLHSGDNPVRFETTGLPLYYSLRVQALLNTTDHPIPSRHAEGASLGLLRVYEAGPSAQTTVVLTLTVAAPLGPSRLDDPLPAGLVRLPTLTFARLDALGAVPIPQDLLSTVRVLADDPGGLHLALAPLAPGTYVLTYGAAPLAAGSYTALPARFALPGDAAGWVQSGSDSLVVDR